MEERNYSTQSFTPYSICPGMIDGFEIEIFSIVTFKFYKSIVPRNLSE